jgi:hypothetical protein
VKAAVATTTIALHPDGNYSIPPSMDPQQMVANALIGALRQSVVIVLLLLSLVEVYRFMIHDS